MHRLLLICIVVSGLLVGCEGGADRDLAKNNLHFAAEVVGQGEEAELGDLVSVRLQAWIDKDGAKGRPVEVAAAEVTSIELQDTELMPGLLETLVGMKEGGSRTVIIGPDKITDQFRPGQLMTSERLWCDVELLDIIDVKLTDLEVGQGQPVAPGDFVEIQYTGWHAAPTGDKADQFISSDEAGEPARLLLGAGMVNEGLDRGLLGMRAGGLRQVVVPPGLGYGDKGKDGVRPGATLIYEIRLLRVFQVTTETLREGGGTPLEAGQRVSFHLQGWLRQADGAKGEEFQNSRSMSSPYTTVVGTFKIQPGIELGLNGMRRGELRRVEVPADLAFGSRGWHRGPRTLVPPNADVIYELDVME